MKSQRAEKAVCLSKPRFATNSPSFPISKCHHTSDKNAVRSNADGVWLLYVCSLILFLSFSRTGFFPSSYFAFGFNIAFAARMSLFSSFLKGPF